MQITPAFRSSSHKEALYIFFLGQDFKEARFQSLHSGYHLTARKHYVGPKLLVIALCTFNFKSVFFLPQHPSIFLPHKKMLPTYLSDLAKILFNLVSCVRRKLRRVNKTKHATWKYSHHFLCGTDLQWDIGTYYKVVQFPPKFMTHYW